MAIGVAPGDPICRTSYCTVSFVHLLAHPEKYNGMRIQLVGYANLEFEGNGFYLSEELFRKASPQDALWLDVDDIKVTPKFTRGWAIIAGTFNADKRGHFGMYAGSIEHIALFDAWDERR